MGMNNFNDVATGVLHYIVSQMPEKKFSLTKEEYEAWRAKQPESSGIVVNASPDGIEIAVFEDSGHLELADQITVEIPENIRDSWVN